MHRWKNIKWMPLLMAITILAIAGFQVYWINKSYDREERTLEMRTNTLFRETIRNLQSAKLRLDRFAQDSPSLAIMEGEVNGRRINPRILRGEKMNNILDVVMQRTGDSSPPRLVVRRMAGRDSLMVLEPGMSRRQNRIMQFLFDVDSLQDSIRVREIELALTKRFAEQNTDVPFAVQRVQTRDTIDRPVYNEVTLGFARPITYRLQLGNTFPYLLNRISPAVLFSLFLVGFTILSFTLLYRNLLRQRRLADIKNEFISNITHELKTPIATVSVAIEALRNFSASLNPQKTKEYLDISANELQRLSLLVDKVLKLSMFEKKEIELKYEPVSLRQVVEEVTASMRLQFEKRKAVVNVEANGEGNLQADRLHLVSVLFNLLDNALKYSDGAPVINIEIEDEETQVRLTVADRGIGIPAEYHNRVFEKFFRVPHGNVHNAKGYGLGLSYVAHVVEQHKGKITVEANVGRETRPTAGRETDSTASRGSRFVIQLPKQGG